MKKGTAVLLGAMLICGGCAQTTAETDTGTDTEEEAEETSAPDEWISYDTLEAAQQHAGFAVTDPGFADYDSLDYEVNEGQQIIEIRYEFGNEEAVIRKGIGIRDVSDLAAESYDKEENGIQNDHDIFLKKNNDLVRLGIWHDDNYSYSLYVSQGLTEREFLSKTAVIQ